MDSLDPELRQALIEAGFRTPLDILTVEPAELARRLQMPDALFIINTVSRAIAPKAEKIDHTSICEWITTGDDALNTLLGGGIRTGHIWEVAGESSSGKTQFALQLSLMAMLSPTSGKLERSTCYITNGSELRTDRLLQIFENHPKFAGFDDSSYVLDNTWRIQMNTSHTLIQALSKDLPALAEQRLNNSPLKLVVIDSLTPLVQPEGRATSAYLTERARILSEVAPLLRSLARTYNLAILVTNQVMDVFEDKIDGAPHSVNELTYKSQATWFSRTPLHLTGDHGGRKEASLGISWAYQLNARIMLTKTLRKRHLPDAETQREFSNKRRRVEIDAPTAVRPSPDPSSGSRTSGTNGPPSMLELSQTPLTIRTFSVLFSEFGPPASIDYIITTSGIHSFPAESDDTKSQPKAQRATIDESAQSPTEGDAIHVASLPFPKMDSQVMANSSEALDESEWALYFPEHFGSTVKDDAEDSEFEWESLPDLEEYAW